MISQLFFKIFSYCWCVGYQAKNTMLEENAAIQMLKGSFYPQFKNSCKNELKNKNSTPLLHKYAVHIILSHGPQMKKLY